MRVPASTEVAQKVAELLAVDIEALAVDEPGFVAVGRATQQEDGIACGNSLALELGVLGHVATDVGSG